MKEEDNNKMRRIEQLGEEKFYPQIKDHSNSWKYVMVGADRFDDDNTSKLSYPTFKAAVQYFERLDKREEIQHHYDF